jgi:hypothetical protein
MHISHIFGDEKTVSHFHTRLNSPSLFISYNFHIKITFYFYFRLQFINVYPY